ncbi:MAG: peptide-methionine (S)-S-oxide reductase MsrA [Phycisphaerae bacterium]
MNALRLQAWACAGLLALLTAGGCVADAPAGSPAATTRAAAQEKPAMTETATFAAGCFWGVQAYFDKIPGVVQTTVGYTGGQTKHPTYDAVCTDRTGHAEAIRIEFDPKKVSYEKLVDEFFYLHDPTTLNRQGPDHGTQYRSAIFYHSVAQEQAARAAIDRLAKSHEFDRPIVTQVVAAGEFTPAESYHQKYFEVRGIEATCHSPRRRK